MQRSDNKPYNPEPQPHKLGLFLCPLTAKSPKTTAKLLICYLGRTAGGAANGSGIADRGRFWRPRYGLLRVGGSRWFFHSTCPKTASSTCLGAQIRER
jgi:hypothetical protein